MSSTVDVRCRDCGADGTANEPCGACGSEQQHVSIRITDTIGVAHTAIKGRVKEPARRSGEKERMRFFSGWDEYKATGEVNWVEQVVDVDNDRYRKLVRKPDGTIIRDVDKPLSEHRGHGSAKMKKPKP